MMTGLRDVLACPFCGESVDLNHPGTWGLDESGKWGTILCGCTEVRTGYDESPDAEWRDRAVAAWNTRANGPELLAVLGEARKYVQYAASRFVENDMGTVEPEAALLVRIDALIGARGDG